MKQIAIQTVGALIMFGEWILSVCLRIINFVRPFGKSWLRWGIYCGWVLTTTLAYEFTRTGALEFKDIKEVPFAVIMLFTLGQLFNVSRAFIDGTVAEEKSNLIKQREK